MTGSLIKLIPVASPLHEPKATLSVLNKYVEALQEHVDSVETLITSTDEIARLKFSNNDLAVVTVLTGGSEQLIMELARKAGHTLILAHKTMNSLPAAIEAYSALRLTPFPATLIAEWPPGDEVVAALRAWKAFAEVRGARISLVGEPSHWLVYSAGKDVEDSIKEIFGVSISYVPLEEIYEEYRGLKNGPADFNELLNGLISKATRSDVPRDDVAKALRLYLALKNVMSSKGVKAFTIRCFDLITDLKTTACLPLALLNSEGWVAGCEGDLPTLVTMMVAKAVSGKPVFMGNLAWIDGEEIMFAHCTIALSLTKSFELKTHFESGIGVGIAGVLDGGSAVTIVKIDPLTRSLRAVEGTIASGIPSSPYHCRTQIKVRVGSSAKQFIEEPLGNHYVIMPGSFSKEMKYLAEYAGLQLV